MYASTAVRLLAVAYMLGFTMVLFASTFVFPLAVSYWTGDAALWAFVQGFLITAGGGTVLCLLTRRHRSELRPRDGFLLVSLAWAGLPALAATPLLLYFHQAGLTLSITDAYFEAVSGLTTTGATVLTHLDTLPPSINLWRTTLIWIGGMGILVLAVAILPLLGIGGYQAFRAEMPGPMKDDKLTPRVASTAKALYGVYFGVSLLCLAAYRLAGLDWFDAWCHMASTMGLGGFSTRDEGFVYFDSPAVEGVAMVFMLIAGISFATHFGALSQRSLRPYLRCPQTFPFLGVVLGSGLLIAAYLYWRGTYDQPLTALRHAMFNTISVATTTGFSNTDYSQWPIFAPALMLLLSTFATSAGSTGGGIKMIRVVVLVKQVRQEIISILHPHAVAPVRIGGRIVDQRVLASVQAFMLVYGGAIIALTMLMLASGLEPDTAFTAVFASLSNTGPGLGAVGPAGNFAILSDFQTWVCTFAMLIGRLELFTMLVLFTPAFWRR